ncbi:DsrE/DsrF/DrsH-like family protein [Anaerocellum danielii]|uniref:DsrE/DsrF/DrsH-like family protein n=1 Tax=Anaerocellum danielii TaxID=1387557 RepID=A0ABZ0TXF0_9FIRM|nr:DsrE/DsrF/DrsH-like family protein [Caldicellulosiruptor danielii]WPX07912.1 DsrE/DsrF/DrsH-like family protein [Caldicellulosiruptor danielii]
MREDKKTIIVFSNEMDKVMAAFVIATGAAAMGDEVTMFFTFWGLNVLRDAKKKAQGKSFLEKMFGAMMPKGVEKLPLSKMNFLGIGPKLMKYMMRKKNVMMLPEMIKQAQELGIKMVACSMSMDVMGIKKEELIDGVEIGGVATYLGEAGEAGVNLFI